MSYPRSPRPVCSTTIGTKKLSIKTLISSVDSTGQPPAGQEEQIQEYRNGAGTKNTGTPQLRKLSCARYEISAGLTIAAQRTEFVFVCFGTLRNTVRILLTLALVVLLLAGCKHTPENR